MIQVDGNLVTHIRTKHIEVHELYPKKVVHENLLRGDVRICVNKCVELTCWEL